MRREPLSDLANTKFSPGDGFHNELVSGHRFHLEKVTIRAEKSIAYRKTDPLVAIEKGMVACKRLHEGCGFVDEVIVVAVLRAKDGRFEEALITKAVNAAKFVDQLAMHLDGFADGQVDVSGRRIHCCDHRDYFARS